MSNLGKASYALPLIQLRNKYQTEGKMTNKKDIIYLR